MLQASNQHYSASGRGRAPPPGSVAFTIKNRMEGGNIFGGGEESQRKEQLKKIYQDDLRKQLEAKNREKEEAKRKQMEEDKREEARIHKELDQLRMQYAQEIKDDGGKRKNDAFDFSNIPQDNNRQEGHKVFILILYYLRISI